MLNSERFSRKSIYYIKIYLYLCTVIISTNQLIISDMKPITNINTREINRYAVKNVVMNNSDSITAISKAAELEVMKKRMMRGEVVRFAYLKADGKTIRVAVGTLQANAVEANVIGTGTAKRFYGQFAYLDLEKMAWRSFREQNFIGTIEG